LHSELVFYLSLVMIQNGTHELIRPSMVGPAFV
jgi:hypothetical protein